MNAGRDNEGIAGRNPAFLVISFGLLVLAALLEFGLKPLQVEYFPVRFVRILGSFKYLEKGDLEQAVRPLIKSGYLKLDVDRICAGAKHIPWIKAVQIRRVWPDTLVIRGEEHAPFARFGENQLLSTEGVVFSPRDIERFADLPMIEGSVAQSVRLLAAFREMQIRAQNSGMMLEKLEVSARESWSVQISGDLNIELGKEAPLETFRRFIATLPLLGEKQIRSMARVDLRYRNGYAVEWKTGAEPQWSSLVKGNDQQSGKAVRSI
ncbi:MAG: cell division protein FtsQ/DivIB [Methylococcaceae bacterium]|nr:cell division protein FtsQ/DivIB [Methylococcaceae bacterium]